MSASVRKDRASSRVEILALTRYDRLGASSRLRTLQYLPYLSEKGLHVRVSPLLSDEYLRRLYSKDFRFFEAAKGVAARLWQLISAREYDLLWIEKELFPFFPAFAETACSAFGVPYIVDYDDALFHRYDAHRNGLVRRTLRGKIASIIRNAVLVMAGNPYLAGHARTVGASRVEILPTVVDLDRYACKKDRGNAKVTVGWVGSPVTAKYLPIVANVLAKLQCEHEIEIRLIGSGPVELGGVEATIVDWTEVSEIEEIAALDIGIMPLPDAPWERGKSGYKLIQYMACGLPVVASPIGINREIVQQGEEGYLAETEEEWKEALGRLIVNPDTRRQMGARGRSKVERRYSLQSHAPRLESFIRSALV